MKLIWRSKLGGVDCCDYSGSKNEFDFIDYTYQKDLSGKQFTQYQIKLRMRSRNAAVVPIIKDLRCMTLANTSRRKFKFKRDPKTGAIVNTDRSEYEKYIAQREARQSDKERLNKLESEISEIKQLLVKLTTGINTK
ncbi:MAG: hypothetical protein CM15mV5_2860 [uncultured marine virus]|nr:MAG: hypothetical protein CM15mV5_2860 [uncultured marine virus]